MAPLALTLIDFRGAQLEVENPRLAYRPQESLAGVNDDFTFFPIRSIMLISKYLPVNSDTSASKGPATCFLPRGKMAIDALSLLVRRLARSKGAEWILEERVVSGPPRELCVDI